MSNDTVAPRLCLDPILTLSPSSPAQPPTRQDFISSPHCNQSNSGTPPDVSGSTSAVFSSAPAVLQVLRQSTAVLRLFSSSPPTVRSSPSARLRPLVGTLHARCLQLDSTRWIFTRPARSAASLGNSVLAPVPLDKFNQGAVTAEQSISHRLFFITAWHYCVASQSGIAK